MSDNHAAVRTMATLCPTPSLLAIPIEIQLAIFAFLVELFPPPPAPPRHPPRDAPPQPGPAPTWMQDTLERFSAPGRPSAYMQDSRASHGPDALRAHQGVWKSAALRCRQSARCRSVWSKRPPRFPAATCRSSSATISMNFSMPNRVFAEVSRYREAPIRPAIFRPCAVSP